MDKQDIIVSTKNLSKRFNTKVATDKGWKKATVAAVSNVTLDIAAGGNAGSCRGERLRKDHAGSDVGAVLSPKRRHDDHSWH